MSRKIFLCFQCILMIACQSCKNEIDKNILSIDINKHDELSSILDSSYTYVMLETCDNGLINEISKIELTEDRIYTLDKRQKEISIFEKNGKFINRIAKRGQGPGEYISLTDIEILNADIYVLARNRIIVYGEDGTWIKTIPLDTYYDYFHIINDSLMYLYSGKSNPSMYDFALFNHATGSFIDRFSPYEKIDGLIADRSPFHQTDSKELMFIDMFDHNIYKLTDTSLVEKYTLECNTPGKFPKDYKEIERAELYDQLASTSVVTRIQYFNQSDDFIALLFPLFQQEYGIRTHFAFINRKNKETKHIRLGDKIDAAFPYFSDPKLLKNGYLVCSMDAHRLLNIEDIASLSHFKGKINEDDNPVIFFYKLKDW